MESRTYAIDEGGKCELLCYKGFNLRMLDAPVVASVFVSGEVEFWALDDEQAAIAEFSRFLADNQDEYRDAIVAFYKAKTKHVPLVY